MPDPAHGNVAAIPAVACLARSTTDLLVIARAMQRTGAGLGSLAELVVDIRRRNPAGWTDFRGFES